MREVRFDSLPKDVRKTLVGSMSRERSPFPLLSSPQSLPAALLGWGSLAAGGIIGAGVLFWWDLGQLYGDFAQQGALFLSLYVMLLAVAGVGAAMAVRRWLEHRALPWPSGVYLFGADLVDATQSTLRLYPLPELLRMQPTHHIQNGTYTHTEFVFAFREATFQFTMRDQRAAEEALSGLRASLVEVGRAARDGDLAALLELDPFVQVRLEEGGFDALRSDGPAATDGPSATSPGPLVRYAPAALALAGAIVAVPVWAVRDRLGDGMAWSTCERRTEQAARSGAEVECWERLERSTPWRAEAHERGGAASVPALKTVTDARRALKEYGDTAARPALEARLAELFADARAKFHEKAAADPAAVAFMDALLDWTERHDTPIPVRFVPPTLTAMELADTMLANDPGLEGQTYVPIAKHFSAATLATRSPVVVQKLQEGFARVIPNDVLPLALGPELDDVASLPADGPVLAVKIDVSPFGDLYSDSKARKAYAGILMSFDVQMRAPSAEPFGFTMQVEPPETFSVQTWSWGNTVTGPSDALVYDTMMARAFEQMVGRTEGAFFARTEPEGGAAPDGVEGLEALSEAELKELLKSLEAAVAAPATP